MQTGAIMKSRYTKRGFTLVELIVVLVILAVLAALLVPALTAYIEKAQQSAVLAKARAVLVASQVVVTEAYADGKLPLDEKGLAYTPPKPNPAHNMAKEIFALAETDYKSCEWRFSLTPTTNTSLPRASILKFEFCDKNYRVTYFAAETEENPAGWSTPMRAESLEKLGNMDEPAFLSSYAYTPDYYHPE